MYSEQAYDLDSIDSVTIKNLKLVSPIKLPKLNKFMVSKPSDFSVFNIEVVIYIVDWSEAALGIHVFRFTSPTIKIWEPDVSNPFGACDIEGNIPYKGSAAIRNHTFLAEILSDSNGFYLSDHTLTLNFANVPT